MGTNIYKIETDNLADFAAYRGTDKIVVFYKPECAFCAAEIEALRKQAKEQEGSIGYAICDVSGKMEFCRENGITALPTIFLYAGGELVRRYESYTQPETLIKALHSEE